jgi:hypothetical protein
MISLYRYPALRKSCVKKPGIPTTNLASPCRSHIDPDQIVGIDISGPCLNGNIFIGHKSWPTPGILDSCRCAQKQRDDIIAAVWT